MKMRVEIDEDLKQAALKCGGGKNLNQLIEDGMRLLINCAEEEALRVKRAKGKRA